MTEEFIDSLTKYRKTRDDNATTQEQQRQTLLTVARQQSRDDPTTLQQLFNKTSLEYFTEQIQRVGKNAPDKEEEMLVRWSEIALPEEISIATEVFRDDTTNMKQYLETIVTPTILAALPYDSVEACLRGIQNAEQHDHMRRIVRLRSCVPYMIGIRQVVEAVQQYYADIVLASSSSDTPPADEFYYIDECLKLHQKAIRIIESACGRKEADQVMKAVLEKKTLSTINGVLLAKRVNDVILHPTGENEKDTTLLRGLAQLSPRITDTSVYIQSLKDHLTHRLLLQTTNNEDFEITFLEGVQATFGTRGSYYFTSVMQLMVTEALSSGNDEVYRAWLLQDESRSAKIRESEPLFELSAMKIVRLSRSRWFSRHEPALVDSVWWQQCLPSTLLRNIGDSYVESLNCERLNISVWMCPTLTTVRANLTLADGAVVSLDYLNVFQLSVLSVLDAHGPLTMEDIAKSISVHPDSQHLRAAVASLCHSKRPIVVKSEEDNKYRVNREGFKPATRIVRVTMPSNYDALMHGGDHFIQPPPLQQITAALPAPPNIRIVKVKLVLTQGSTVPPHLTCAFCKINLVNLCLHCEQGGDALYDPATCDVVQVISCGHMFHNHCMYMMTRRTRPTCPLCNEGDLDDIQLIPMGH